MRRIETRSIAAGQNLIMVRAQFALSRHSKNYSEGN